MSTGSMHGHALLIAEKPDLMRKIEEVYRSNRDKIPYEITFTSQRGHLLTLKSPDELDEELKVWSWDTLPIHPEKLGGWQYKVIQDKGGGKFMTSRERYEQIRDELRSGDYDFVINAGDPDQEGQLLIRIVLDHAKNKLPVRRFWTNDLTEGHILGALLNLRDDDHDEYLIHLLDAAYARQHSDYRFGMNVSRAATLKMGIRVACGRVKTPLLAIVCKREDEIMRFVPKTVFGVKATYAEGFEGTLFEPKGKAEKETEEDEEEKTGIIWFDTQKEAKELIDSLKDKAKVVSYTAKRQTSYAPKLFKLATAQIEAGKMGYSAADTLRIIQKLYEKKILSYPRTGCEYVSSDEDFPGLLAAASAVPDLQPFIEKITNGDITRVKASKSWVNDKALSDEGHSALVPTTTKPDWDDLEDEEKDIYRMVCRQFVAIFLPPLVQDRATLVTDIDGHAFRSSGKTLIDPGYTRIFGRNMTDSFLPAHAEGDILDVTEYTVPEKTSTCPKRYTTADLIAVCENPLKYLDDDSYKKLGKRLKIGTPATRSNIIDELIHRDKYLKLKKEGKKEVLQPTEDGARIIKNLGDCEITKVDMTGEWEEKLEQVRKGELSLPGLEREMMDDVERLIKVIRDSNIVRIEREGYRSLGKCPLCGKTLMHGPSKFYCTGYKEGCKAGGYREVNGAVIEDAEFLKMMKGEKITKTMTRNGVSWEQEVSCDQATGQILYPVTRTETEYECPVCRKKIIETDRGYECSDYKDKKCGFYLSKTLGGVTIPENEFDRFFKTGRTGVIENLYSKKTGKTFSAYMAYEPEKKATKLFFAPVTTDYTCPCCGKPLLRDGFRLICKGTDDGSCHFSMYAQTGKTDLSPEKIRHLLSLVKDGKVSGGEKAYLTGGPVRTPYKCPYCGKDVMRENGKLFCIGTKDAACSFTLQRNFAGHYLEDEEIKDLLCEGKTQPIHDFVSKKGSTFSARIVLDKDARKASFEFSDEGTPSKYACPCCGKPLTETSRKLTCGCGFGMWKSAGGKMLEEAELKRLFEKGETHYLRMKSKAGRAFTAKIVLDKENRTTTYSYKN